MLPLWPILLLLRLARPVASLTAEEMAGLKPVLIPAAAAHFGPGGPHAPAGDLREAVKQARLEVQDSWRNRRSIVFAAMSGAASFKDVNLVFFKTLKANTFLMPADNKTSHLARHTIMHGTSDSATAACKALQATYEHHCVSPIAMGARPANNASDRGAHFAFDSVRREPVGQEPASVVVRGIEGHGHGLAAHCAAGLLLLAIACAQRLDVRSARMRHRHGHDGM